jgi:hypothetical protein
VTEQDVGELEVMERVAEKLQSKGFNVYVQNTGGDIMCVIVEGPQGREGRWTAWGTAGDTWGAEIRAGEAEEYVGSLETSVPSDSTDAVQIAAAIADAVGKLSS